MPFKKKQKKKEKTSKDTGEFHVPILYVNRERVNIGCIYKSIREYSSSKLSRSNVVSSVNK